MNNFTLQNNRANTPDFSLYCVMAGYFIAYLLFFVFPTYFAGAVVMRAEPTIPVINPIGADLVRNMKVCGDLLFNGTHDGKSFIFSPFYVLVFGMLSTLTDTGARAIFALLSTASYIVACLCALRWLTGTKRIPRVTIFVMVAGLASYGFAFDLERAQWNLPVTLLCLGAISLWHTGVTRKRVLAAVLYAIAVHLKIWPIFLCFCFVAPAAGVIRNVKTLVYLGICNVLLLFVLGPSFLVRYVDIVRSRLPHTNNFWSGNMSIASLTFKLSEKTGYASSAGALLYILTLVSVVYVLYTMYRNGYNGNNVNVIAACTLAALLIPKVSHDYKLTILTVVMAIYFGDIKITVNNKIKLCLQLSLLIVISICYNITLYANWQKRFAGMFTPNTPLLVVILVCIAMMVVVNNERFTEKRSNV